MANPKHGCLICGKPLVYFDAPQKLECQFCHKVFEAEVSCEDGHFVCDACHAAQGVKVILDYCRSSTSKSPIDMIREIMGDPYIYMHGPEHHIMVGAVLLTAYKNAGGQIDLEKALQEMKRRGGKYPGGSCGTWGTCGAAVSTGIFMSIVTGNTPLNAEAWGVCNRMTAGSLLAVGEIGGPRCCKRNSFTTILHAVEFVKRELGVEMEVPETIVCGFFNENQQCLHERCPYNPVNYKK